MRRRFESEENRRHWTRAKLTLAAASIFVVVVVFALGLGNQHPPPIEASPSVQASPLEIPSHARVLIVGDSYTRGVGAKPQTAGYAYRISTLTDWEVTIEGFSGTGYLNDGHAHEGTYAQRIAQFSYADDFDVIVVQGSSNDASQDLSLLRSAVSGTIGLLESKYPGAKLVLVGPVSAAFRPGSEGKAGRIDAILAQFSFDFAIPYLSPYRESWIVGSEMSLIDADGIHPNNAGHELIARRIVSELEYLQLKS